MTCLRNNKYSVIVMVSFLVICNIIFAWDAISNSNNNYLYPFEQNGKWGFIDHNGIIRIEPQYLYADEFQEGLAGVLVGETEEDCLFGFINSKGDFVIEPRFYVSDSFSEGLAMVEFEPYVFGCIDKTGNVVFELSDFADSYHEGLAAAGDLQSGLMGYIDKTGKWVIQPKYWPAESFSEGLASVCHERKRGYINTRGEEVIPLAYYSAGNFCEGLAWVMTDMFTGFYIDREGKRVSELDFPYIGKRFSEGVTYASVDNKHYGYVNQKGEWVIQPKFSKAENFSEGLAFVKIGDQSYFIDKNGEITITLEGVTSCAQGFKNGIARVNRGRQEVFINKEGKIIFIP